MTLAIVKTKLITALQDGDNVLTPAQHEIAIVEAGGIYSKRRPYEVVADITGDGDFEYDLPANFLATFSEISSVEYPIDERPVMIMDTAQWYVYRTANATYKMRFVETLSSGVVARISYTIPHTLSNSVWTVPEIDNDAIKNKAASICCAWLAAHYSQLGQSTLNADAAQHQSKATHYRSQMRVFDQLYDEHMGLSISNVVPASASRQYKMLSTYGVRLTHG